MTKMSDPTGRGAKRAGIRDVARLAGVAPMTVSRALSFPHLVSAETREKVAAAIAATGYIPNRVASSLSSNQTMTIGAVIPTLRNSIAADFAEGLLQVGNRHGRRLDRYVERLEVLRVLERSPKRRCYENVHGIPPENCR